jgi:hypothetical protein
MASHGTQEISPASCAFVFSASIWETYSVVVIDAFSGASLLTRLMLGADVRNEICCRCFDLRITKIAIHVEELKWKKGKIKQSIRLF